MSDSEGNDRGKVEVEVRNCNGDKCSTDFSSTFKYTIPETKGKEETLAIT